MPARPQREGLAIGHVAQRHCTAVNGLLTAALHTAPLLSTALQRRRTEGVGRSVGVRWRWYARALPQVEILREASAVAAVHLQSFELWEATTGRLVAGEIGVVVGECDY